MFIVDSLVDGDGERLGDDGELIRKCEISYQSLFSAGFSDGFR